MGVFSVRGMFWVVLGLFFGGVSGRVGVVVVGVEFGAFVGAWVPVSRARR